MRIGHHDVPADFVLTLSTVQSDGEVPVSTDAVHLHQVTQSKIGFHGNKSGMNKERRSMYVMSEPKKCFTDSCSRGLRK